MADLHPEQRAALAYVETRGTQAPVESIRSRLHRIVAEADELLQGISPEAARRSPPDGGWSVLEVVDHLVVSHRPAAEELRELLAGREPQGGPIPAGLQSDDVGTLAWDEALRRFRQVHHDFLARVDGAEDATPQTARAPVLMVVKCRTADGLVPIHWTEVFDWKAYTLLVGLHVKEHLAQIRRVLADVDSAA